MHQVNWGIIGCGNVTELKSGPAFGKVDGSRVVAVMRRDADKAKDYANRHHIPAWYSKADELIDSEEVNAVYVATPPASHAGYAIRAMEKGKPVYVEKPMAATYSDCLKMQEVSVATGVPLYVAYYRRFLPYFIKVKELIDSGRLGTLLYAKLDFHIPPRTEDWNAEDLPWRVKPEIAGAGYFYDLACHQLDLFEWFFGEVADTWGKTFNRRGLYPAEDLVFAQLSYALGMQLAGQWCFAAAENEHSDTISIHGSKGSIAFSTFDFTPIRLTTGGKTEEYVPGNPENIQYWFIRNMVEELRGIRPAFPNGESAVRTNKLMDKILGKL